MTLNQLAYFIATCENNNSMTRAAKRLYISQPTVSLAIRDLEEEFNIQLFFRSNNQLYLTTSGKRFFAMAKEIYDAAERLSKEFKSLSQEGPGLRIGMTSLVHGLIAGCASMDEYGWLSPYSNSSSFIFTTPDLLRLLDEDKIDMAIIGTSRFDNYSGYDSFLIAERVTSLYAPISSRFATRKSVTIHELMNEPIILYLENVNFMASAVDTMRAFLPNLTIDNIAGYTTFLSAVEDYVESEKGSVLLANGLFKSNNRIVMLDIEDALPFQIKALVKKRHGLSTDATHYIQYLRHIMI